LRSYERVHAAVKGSDRVIHLAALPSVPRSVQDPLTSNETNVTGTLNTLLAARDEAVSRVVIASSSSVYGANDGMPKREDMVPKPISPYGVSKLAAEQYTHAFSCVYGLETVALRYFNVFGPRQDPTSFYSAVIPKFITRLAAGERPTVFGDGEQSRDFTYIDNVLDANLLAVERPDAAGEVINVACGTRITLNALLETLRAILGVDTPAEHGPARPGDVRHSLADIEKARRLLSFEPRVGIREGLERTAAFFVPSRRR
jgi:nucleoside-diphosphate-sugar epimerase